MIEKEVIIDAILRIIENPNEGKITVDANDIKILIRYIYEQENEIRRKVWDDTTLYQK